MFTHLHVHTEYSLLDGMCRISPLVKKAKELGMESLAITDHGVMYGLVSFFREAKAAGIKPILGCEVYVAPRSHLDKTPADKSGHHLVLLAKDNTGYHNLIKLTTAAHLDGFYYKPRVDKELLQKHHQGLIALSACPSGEIARLILDGRIDEAGKTASWYKEVFGDYYLELQHHDMPELVQINKALVEMSKKLDIPLVVTNDSHYINKDDSYAHDILLCIQTNNTITSEKRPKMTGDSFYLKSPEEMAALFPELPEAVTNTGRIAGMCNLDLEFGRQYMPEFELPAGTTADDVLSQRAREGLRMRYGEPSQEVAQRLEYELDVIRKTKFANYFLVVSDVVAFAKEKKILYGVRGSAAASIVLYCLELTDADPLAQRLVFERFLNIERKEMPDIDLDFQDDRRAEVISHVAEKYGAGHVAQIITFGTLGARAALRDVGRALGMPYSDVDRVVKMIPATMTSLDEAIENIPDLKSIYQKEPTIKHLVDTSRKLEGVSRHASTHAAGVVICKEPLVNIVPLQRPSKSDEQALNMTQYAMDEIAKIGLLKMDFLGLANLTILGKAKESIAGNHKVELDLHHLRLDDEKTYALLSSGDTTGVFQLEGAGMRHILKELKPNTFSDLAAIVALYRPGPKEQIPRFIASKHGREPIRFPHPALTDILKETYGIIVYQDQVLHIVRAFAGYSLGEADIVRKAMGKKIPEIMQKEKQKFLDGAVKKGFEPALADEVWALIEPFAGYAFNKAHSVSYALIAYQTAYLKANYAPEFMSALLTINMDQPDKIASAVAECERLGIKVLPPHINKSAEAFTIEQDGNSNGLRFALTAIKNVGASALKPILAEREKGGPFKSVEDFCRRADLKSINKRVMESLIKAGALDCVAERGSLLAGIDRILSLAQREQRLKESGQSTMFDMLGDSVDTPLPCLELPQAEAAVKDKLAWEKELLGVYFSDHPLGRAGLRLAVEGGVLCSQITEELEGKIVAVAGAVSSVRHAQTREQKPFVSAVIEDCSGNTEVTAWSKVYESTRHLWVDGNVLLIKGKVKTRGDRAQLTCYEVSAYKEPQKDSEEPDEPPRQQAPTRHRLHISLSPCEDSETDMERLKQIFTVLRQFPGDGRVHLTICGEEGSRSLELPGSACGPEAYQQLKTIVGEKALALEEVA